MARVKWSIDPDEPDDLPAFDAYDGPDAPAGVYNFRLRRLGLKRNKNDDDMLNGLLVVHESRPDKKQYNGFTVWFNQNVTEQGKPYIKQFLTSLGISWSEYMKKTIHDGDKADDRPAQITVLGGVKLEKEPQLRAQIKNDTDQNGKPKMSVAQFLPPKDEDEEEYDSDDEASDDEDPFA